MINNCCLMDFTAAVKEWYLIAVLQSEDFRIKKRNTGCLFHQSLSFKFQTVSGPSDNTEKVYMCFSVAFPKVLWRNIFYFILLKFFFHIFNHEQFPHPPLITVPLPTSCLPYIHSYSFPFRKGQASRGYRTDTAFQLILEIPLTFLLHTLES